MALNNIFEPTYRVTMSTTNRYFFPGIVIARHFQRGNILHQLATLRSTVFATESFNFSRTMKREKEYSLDVSSLSTDCYALNYIPLAAVCVHACNVTEGCRAYRTCAKQRDGIRLEERASSEISVH